MADPTTPSAKTPWHLWVVGALSLLWNSMGVLDFTLTQMHNEAWLKQIPPPLLAYYFSFPFWVLAAWCVGTYGGFVGSLLLLFRKKLAVVFFVASLAGMILTDFYSFVLSDGRKYGGMGFAAVIFTIGVLLLVYARAMRRRGVLR